MGVTDGRCDCGGSVLGTGGLRGKLEVVKELTSRCCYQTANVILNYVSRLDCAGQRKKWWRAVVIQSENPRPVSPKTGETRAGHPPE